LDWGPDLRCFVAEHAKDSLLEEKSMVIAVVKVLKGIDFEVDSEMMEIYLGRKYPWKWEWQAKENTEMGFPGQFSTVSRISEVAIYDWVAPIGAHIKINVK
jgi:hypothetical protein